MTTLVERTDRDSLNHLQKPIILSQKWPFTWYSYRLFNSSLVHELTNPRVSGIAAWYAKYLLSCYSLYMRMVILRALATRRDGSLIQIEFPLSKIILTIIIIIYRKSSLLYQDKLSLMMSWNFIFFSLFKSI